MLLYFHKDPHGKFGDDLNPWLWSRIFPGLFDGEVHHDPRTRAPFAADAPLFVGIGTLLNEHVPPANPKLVFGAGVGYGDAPRIDARWRFVFVRGPLTAHKLGLPPDTALTDPAVLAADYAGPPRPGPRRVAYMPHCASARHGDWATLCEEAGLHFIDPRWPVERVLLELRSASTLITEALHGAILAEAFRVPWAPVKSSPTVLDFKWHDWCQSLGRAYEPEPLPSLWRPTPSMFGRLRFRLKRGAARGALQRLARRHHARLADDTRVAELKARLVERIERFRAELPVPDHANG